MSDVPLPDAAKRWLQLAREDLGAARAMLGVASVAPRIVCFLSQQAAEKALKAGLISVGRPFPKIHGLTSLLALYPDDIRPEIDEDDLDLLDPWVIDGRYAADLPDVEIDQARHLVEVAGRVVDEVSLLVPKAP
jgi:HEPN domain-containing protein